MFSFAFLSLFCCCWLILVSISCIYCKYVLRPSPRYVDVCDRYDRLGAPLSFGSTMRSGHNLGFWRCRLNLFMFLLTILVGRFWSVHSVLEFNAIKKNSRIVSDIERVFWTVLFCMASRVFLFFTPSDSSRKRLKEAENRQPWVLMDTTHTHWTAARRAKLRFTTTLLLKSHDL